jgi:YD repeat-containing protein
MKQLMFSKVLTIVACALMLCVLAPTLAVADQAQYIYDDLGRLSQVIDGQGNVATYSYDAVGNLLSITRNTGGVGAPTITGLTPNTGNAGTSVTVSITGTNLTGAALATDNPGILVRNVLTTPTSVSGSKGSGVFFEEANKKRGQAGSPMMCPIRVSAMGRHRPLRECFDEWAS